MGDEERQEQFREEVRGYLANDKVTLEHLTDRLDKLEKTVLHGNGSPSMMQQITELRTRMEGLDKKMDRIDEMQTSITEIKTELSKLTGQLDANSRNSANWVGVGLVILTIIGTALVDRFF